MNLKREFSSRGYIIVDLTRDSKVTNEFNPQNIINDIAIKIKSNDAKLNPKFYHYNEFPRIIEGWKFSASIKALALNSFILRILETLYNREPIAFSTINFVKGSEQPFHSDYFHFGSMPELMLAGVWVALEDIDPMAGGLALVPGSNNLPIVMPEDLGITYKPKSTPEIKQIYTRYESYVEKLIREDNLCIEIPALRKGQAIIWDANLLHGGAPILNYELTRYSQVTHYHFKGCQYFYNPIFSSRSLYTRRDITNSIIEP